MIDDQNLNWSFLRFQFQSKLLLNCSEDRRPGRVGRRSGVNPRRAWRTLVLIWRPLQREVILARETGLVQNVAAQLLRQQAHQVRDRNPLPPYWPSVSFHEHHARPSAAIGAFESVRVSVA